eukprot:1161625-Pelagomonas_calceolata.AAC.21
MAIADFAGLIEVPNCFQTAGAQLDGRPACGSGTRAAWPGHPKMIGLNQMIQTPNSFQTAGA